MSELVLPASFRDPSGFLFFRDGTLYRQVNNCYESAYLRLMESGLYKHLVDAGLLIPHAESDLSYARTDEACRILRPEKISFVSYPYEWCFSQLREAALVTLAVQKTALSYGMSLKDASAYNIQFRDGRAILIDTLSFKVYREGEPWVAYRQFCQHFFAPLVLMAGTDVRLGQLMRVHIDGIPLDLASKLLPWTNRLKFSTMIHVYLHARSQRRYAGRHVPVNRKRVTRRGMLGLIDSLETAIRKLRWRAGETEWSQYYDETNYSEGSMRHKEELVAGYLRQLEPENVWDLGANTGRFSRLAAEVGIPTIAFDVDPSAVEQNYLECCRKGEGNILPLLLDLTNPSPALGWENRERMSLPERGPADTVLALALIHHLAISNNVPLDRIAAFFARLCRSLIVEFIPKSDSQVQRLLSSREDIFGDYTQVDFEKQFGLHFRIDRAQRIRGSERFLYLMHKR